MSAYVPMSFQYCEAFLHQFTPALKNVDIYNPSLLAKIIGKRFLERNVEVYIVFRVKDTSQQPVYAQGL